MTSDLSSRIRSRGYWTVLVRPEVFREKHIDNIALLEDIVRRNAVELRGWMFPQVLGIRTSSVGLDYVSEGSTFHHHLEVWRLYQSGQFLDLSSYKDDWRDISKLWPPPSSGWTPGQTWSVAETVYRFAEVFEFAARLAMSPAGDRRMVVEITAHNLRGRRLTMDIAGKIPMLHEYTASLDEFPQPLSVAREELIADTRGLAARAARELLVRFGWSVQVQWVANILDQLLAARST